MCKISIIVPIYNKEPYLRECLDSILNQTLKDIEIICIDDKSTDDSLSIVNEYALKDNRIKTITNNINRGLSTTRNIGMKAASGKFIAFMDADDFVDKDFYEKLYETSDSYDVVKGEIWEYDGKINKCAKSDLSRANEKIKETGNPLYFYYGITSAIFRREFVLSRNLYFDEDLFYNEDTVFVLSVTTKTDRIKVVDNAKYYYRFVSDSLSRTYSKRVIDSLYLSAMLTIKRISECDLSVENKSIVLDYLFTLVSFFVNSRMLNHKQIYDIKTEYLKYIKEDSNKNQNLVKVSVVVPVYNGEESLRRALFCLTLQTLYDIEIVCVNDGSTDSSLDIINEFARDDDRIKVINCEKNGGVSKARNIGVTRAIGEYIAFMDCDDQIDLSFYKKLYESAKSTNADISKGNIIEINYEGELHPATVTPVEKSPYYFCNGFSSGIYRNSMIVDSGIVFPEGHTLGEDLKFLFDAVSCANKVSLVCNVFYYYVRRYNSADSVKTSFDNIESEIKIFNYILSKIEERNFYINETELYALYYSMYISHMVERIIKCKDEKSKRLVIDYLFELFNLCKAKEEIIKGVRISSPLLADAFKNNDKVFYKNIVIKDHLSDIFYRNKLSLLLKPVSCCIVAAYSDKKLLNNVIVNNAFLKEETKITYYLIDNQDLNINISNRYNSYLQNYDYSNDTWFIFVKCGFEFLSFPSNILKNLDKDKIYGPIGSKAYFDQYKVGYALKGKVYKKDLENNFHDSYSKQYTNPEVDTLDSMCLIIHSSLVKRYGLRFDEKIRTCLYVEDFCINARRYGIAVENVSFECAYYSSGIDSFKNEQFLEQLKYINEKYENELYGGVISPIGGKNMPRMSEAEFSMYKIRYEIKNKKKL